MKNITLELTQSVVKKFMHDITPSIKGVHINAEKQRLEMTNGYILAVIPIEIDGNESVTLPVDAFPKSASNITTVEHIEGLRWSVTETNKKKGKIRGLISERIVTAIEDEYPDVQVFITESKPVPVGQIGVDAAFFEPFYALDKQTGGNGRVKLTFHGELDAIFVQPTYYNLDSFFGLIMPCG